MAMMAAATGLNLAGAKMSADAGNAAAKAEQAQLNAAATQEDAAGQHAAEQARRKSALMLSRAIAVGAASGAGTAGLDSILRGIAQEGETQAGYTTYESTEKSKGMRYRGQVGVSEAKARGKATMMQAVASSAMTLAAAYGGGGLAADTQAGRLAGQEAGLSSLDTLGWGGATTGPQGYFNKLFR